MSKMRVDGSLMLYLSLPGALAGILLFAAELAAASGTAAVTLKSYQKMLWYLMFILLLPTAFGIAYYHVKLGPSMPLRAFGPIRRFFCERIFGPLFVFYVDGFVAFFFMYLPALLIALHVSIAGKYPEKGHPIFLIVVASLPLLTGLSAVRRCLWVSQIKRQLENLASSRPASAALGLVEMIGTVRQIEDPPDGDPAVIKLPPLYTAFYRKGAMGAMEKVKPLIRPFYLEDERGRVRVVPPEERDSFAPNYFLNFDERDAVRVLREGERSYILGELANDREADEPLLRPWETPRGPLCRTLAKLFGPIARMLDPFGARFLFITSTGDEGETRRKFFRSRYRWAFFGGVLLLGGGITMAVGIAMMNGYPLIRSFGA